MALTACTLAVGLTAGERAFEQRSAEGFAERRHTLHQPLPASLESEEGEFRQGLSFPHMMVRLYTQTSKTPNANYVCANLPAKLLICREIYFPCEVPGQLPGGRYDGSVPAHQPFGNYIGSQ